MRSNNVYSQQVRKNIGYNKQDKHPIPIFHLNNFGNFRYERKINQQRSCQKNVNNQKRENKLKQKNQLKKQLNIIMHDAKIRKQFSPSYMQGKFTQDLSLQNKSNKKIISPHKISKTSTYKIKNRQDIHQKKKSNGQLDVQKRTPSWLNKKIKNQINVQTKNTELQDELSKSRQNQKSPFQIDQKNKNQSRLFILQQKQYQLETIKNTKSFSNLGKDNKQCYYQVMQQSRDIRPSMVSGAISEIDKVISEKQRIEMKFELENALQDKNILLNKIDSMELQLSLNKKKLQQWKQIQDSYKQNERKLKQKIYELQEKLFSTRQQIGKIYNQDQSDREIFAKKNEQILRLNEIIMSNRKKIGDINNQLSSQRIKNIKAIKNLQQKFLLTLKYKNNEIEYWSNLAEKKQKQFNQINNDLHEKMKILKQHFLHQVSKQHDYSTNVQCFLQKLNIEDTNRNLFQSPKNKQPLHPKTSSFTQN